MQAWASLVERECHLILQRNKALAMFQRRMARWTDKLVHNLFKLPVFRQSCLNRVGSDESLLVQAIRHNVNQNDLALYNLLHIWRIVRENAEYSNVDLRRKRILEIGTSKLPGLPLIILLEGCQHYYANNVFTVHDSLPESSGELLAAFLLGLRHCDPDRVEQVLRWEQVDERRVGRLDPTCFTNLSPVPAEDIDLPDNSVDVVFSIAVFEHLSNPSAVLENTFRILKPGGWCFHAIDLRDHRDFARPLEFLKLNDSAYRQACPAGENRWRASDFLHACTAVGWDVERAQFIDEALRLAGGTRTDAWFQIHHRQNVHSSLAAFDPWVSREMRSSFSEPFSEKSLQDLSVLSMSISCRKAPTEHAEAA